MIKEKKRVTSSLEIGRIEFVLFTSFHFPLQGQVATVLVEVRPGVSICGEMSVPVGPMSLP